MPATSPPLAAPVTRSRWRWVKRGLAVLGVLLLLLVLFHRPLAHWAIRHFGGGALTKAGITGGWKTSGSLLGGLVIDDLKLTGDGSSQVRSVTLEHAALDYDLAALRTGGPGRVLKSLTVRNLDAELDLTIPRPPSKPSRPSGPKKKPVLPAVELPAIKIENLTLRMRLPDHLLVVKSFSLELDPAKPGFIQAEEIDVPGTPVMRSVKGITRATPTTLTLEQLQLYPETVVETLLLDVADLPRDEASVSLAARHGPTRVALSGRSGGWFTEVTAEADLRLENISQETLAFWGVPSGGAAWQAGKAALKVKGPVLRPDQLFLKLDVDGGGVTLPDLELSGIGLAADAADGRFALTKLTAASGINTASARAETALPESWAGIADVPGQLDLAFDAPALGDFVPPAAGFSGAAQGTAKAGFADGKLTEAAAAFGMAGLSIKGVPVESARSRVALRDNVVRLEELKVSLNAGNTLEAAGQLNLSGEKDLSVKWRADAADLATVPVEVTSGLMWPTAGRVQSEGTASGFLTKWQAGDWTSLTALATVEAGGLRMDKAALESLSLRAEAKGGAVSLEKALVKLDEANYLTLKGGLNLNDESWPVTADVVLEMPDVTKASAWSRHFKGPALEAGAVAADWQGSAGLKPLTINGQGRALVKGLKLEKIPEVLGLTAEVSQSGSDVQLTAFKASAGPWRAEGSAHYDGFHLSVPELQAFVKNERLVDLSARVPVRAEGLPPDSPISLKLKVDQLDGARLATALGQELPVQGVLSADGEFKGTLNKLEGSLQVTAKGLKPVRAEGPKTEPAEVVLTTSLKAGRLSLAGSAHQRPLQPLTITAGLPLDIPALMADPGAASSLPVSAQVRLPSSSLSFLPAWVPALRTVEGTAAADFSVTGTVGKPVWKGGATIAAAQASFESSSLPTVKDVAVRLRVDERRFTVDEASVVLAGGRLRVTGGAGLDNPKDPALDFKLAADEVLVVRDDNLSLRANAGITCTGRLSKAHVRGQVDLVRGRVFKEIEFLPLSLPDDLPPPPPPTTLGKQGPPALPAPLDKWDFDIAIKTRDPVRLMGNVAKGNAVADLRFSGAGANPHLTGAVRLEEMWLKLPFSRLNITEGVISFNKEQPFDPQINITGESVTGSRIVQVFVQGRALDPKVRLTSSPPLPEGEIASLLATGVTTSDLTSSGDEAAGRAAFVLLKQTYRKIFRKAATESDDDEPPRLSFDFSVFGSDPSRRGISAIYELNPKWRIIGRVGETGTFRGLLHYLIRFR